jgi:hypothetical protein
MSTFISYSHDNDEHKEFVLTLADRLNREGVDCWIDRYVEHDLKDGWPIWMEEKIRTSEFVMVICTKRYLDVFERRVEPNQKLGGVFESTLIINEIYQGQFQNTKFIPIILNDDATGFIPKPLQLVNRYNLKSDEGYHQLYRRLTNQPLIVKPEVGEIIVFEKVRGIDDLVTDYDRKQHPVLTLSVPDVPEITENMKPGLKIVQAFFSLPVTKRFAIAQELGLLNDGESLEFFTDDKMFTNILLRAKANKLLGALWSKLFDENIDPNPFVHK